MNEIKEESLLEPSKIYPELKQTVHNNADEFFTELVKNAKIDEEENKKDCDAYYAKLKEIEDLKKSAGSTKGLKTFLIVLIVICFLFGLILFFVGLASESVGMKVGMIIVGVLLIAGGIGLIFTITKNINKQLKKKEDAIKNAEAEAKNMLDNIYAKLAALNQSFDWGMPQKVIRSSAPLIQLDSNLDVGKYQYMVEKYGLIHNQDPHSSIFCLQSGSVKGNPFFLERNFNQTDGTKTYTGTKVISWTTYTRDSKGRSRAVHHTQTLVATVSKPCPYYGFETYFVYCNDAAPNLTFTRKPTVDIKATEKDLAKQIKKDDKKMDKLAEKSLMDDDPHDFVEMNNTEFESLFHAWDRDNETEFRLLFTPLAQENMTKLLKMKEPYGDDFSFRKFKRINVIESKHDQNLDFEGDPSRFIGFDLSKMKEGFVNYTDYLFQSIFFDIAPLLSIPLYQQMKPIEYIYKDVYDSNISYYEHEVAANAFNQDYFKPTGCATPVILKTHFNGKHGDYDDVTVTAYGFRTVEHVDMVPKAGGDGHIHQVPVVWLEYIPIQQDKMMQVQKKNMSLPEYRTANGNQNFTSIFRNRIEAILNPNH